MDEQREIIIGHSAGRRLLAVCFSAREETVRIFGGRSARSRSGEIMKRRPIVNASVGAPADINAEYHFD